MPNRSGAPVSYSQPFFAHEAPQNSNVVLDSCRRPFLPFLSFENVSYRIGGRSILENLSFTLEPGETLVLLGRSGSGKTTALRLVNRMLTPASGRILLEGADIQTLDPIALRRRIGYVIQDVGLLPHWTVSENAGPGAKARILAR